MIVDFFTANWYLFLALLLVGGLIAFDLTRGGSSTVSVVELAQVVGDTGAIVDVRKNSEFRKGHLPGAINVPSEEFESSKKLAKFKEQPVVLVCNTGTTATSLRARLSAQDFTDVRVLKGGIAEWTRENLPLDKT
ncbi:rhodanese-like domain-containing protein [Gammaproteobacteria bacterium]|nr:rhodanese-like domain-containing protein [Gammaproteobacteria bacterium]